MFLNQYDRHTSDEQANELLDTFRTPFWLHEHQWYVRCDWYHGCLYTLPYAFDLFTNTAQDITRSQWTCPDDKNFWSFNSVHTFDSSKGNLHFWKHNHCCGTKETHDYSVLYPALFPNIHKLQIRTPLSDIIWHIIPTLNHLTTLHLCIHGEESESKFQALLDRAPHLYSLTVFLFTPLSQIMVLFRLTSASIRRLRLHPYARHMSYDFDDTLCTTFARSPLALKCEVLEIRVISPDSIVNLVNSITNLRAMTVHVRDDMRIQDRRTKTELIEWIQNHLSARCLIKSGMDGACCFVISLWIG